MAVAWPDRRVNVDRHYLCLCTRGGAASWRHIIPRDPGELSTVELPGGCAEAAGRRTRCGIPALGRLQLCKRGAWPLPRSGNIVADHGDTGTAPTTQPRTSGSRT